MVDVAENTEHLSTFEKKQKRLEQKIQEVEEELIAEKQWTLKGEVAECSRCLLFASDLLPDCVESSP
jgi:U3 small nucleolar RNA-associated protein MPP10